VGAAAEAGSEVVRMKADVAARLETVWRTSNWEAIEFKDPYLVDKRVAALYLRLPFEERLAADAVLADWVLSEDQPRRAVARALLSEERVRSALPALRALSERLGLSVDVGAPYEHEQVEREITSLEAVTVRHQLDVLWWWAVRDADELVDPSIPSRWVGAFCRVLSEADRAAADEVLVEWARSDDERQREAARELLRKSAGTDVPDDEPV
jgi:hypothetical protein